MKVIIDDQLMEVRAVDYKIWNEGDEEPDKEETFFLSGEERKRTVAQSAIRRLLLKEEIKKNENRKILVKLGSKCYSVNFNVRWLPSISDMLITEE